MSPRPRPDDERAAENPLLAQRAEQRILLVLITGDKGLAGAFNSNLIKGAQRSSRSITAREVKLELIGRKGRDFFRKRGATISGEHIGLAAKVALRRHRRHRAQGDGAATATTRSTRST